MAPHFSPAVSNAAGPGNRSGSDWKRIEIKKCLPRPAFVASSALQTKSRQQTEFPPQTNLVELNGMGLKKRRIFVVSVFRSRSRLPGKPAVPHFFAGLPDFPNPPTPPNNLKFIIPHSQFACFPHRLNPHCPSVPLHRNLHGTPGRRLTFTTPIFLPATREIIAPQIQLAAAVI